MSDIDLLDLRNLNYDKMTLFSEGAEAKLYLIDDQILLKERIVKSYKLRELDSKQRRSRNKREFKILTKLYDEGISVPKPLKLIDDKTKDKYLFLFEKIDGTLLKYCIKKSELFSSWNEIIKMHNLNIVHNDLTTLNILTKQGLIYLIDFGLSKVSSKIEDKAVDLNLFLTSIKNEHSELYKHKELLLKIYTKKAVFGENIINRVLEIERRGRNKKKL